MKRGAVLGLLLVCLVGCAPMASAPVGGGTDRVCRWVREQVENGSMPIEQAEDWYGHCGPFTEPSA